MQNPRPVKYGFDTVFGGGNGSGRSRSTYSAEEVELLRSQATAQGRADTEAGAAALRAEALARVSAALQQLVPQMDQTVSGLREHAVSLSLQVAQCLAGAALAAFPANEARELLAGIMQKLHREPRLVVRASPAVAEALRAELDALLEAQGYQGRVVVLDDPAFREAACRVEWAEGGVEHDPAQTLAAVEAALSRWRANVSIREN